MRQMALSSDADIRRMLSKADDDPKEFLLIVDLKRYFKGWCSMPFQPFAVFLERGKYPDLERLKSPFIEHELLDQYKDQYKIKYELPPIVPVKYPPLQIEMPPMEIPYIPPLPPGYVIPKRQLIVIKTK